MADGTSMREILLSAGKVAKVSDEDYDWLSQWKWSATENRKGQWYARRAIKKEGKRTTLYMHVALMDKLGLPQVDHQNLDGLDNQRHNLRPATVSQNQANRTRRRRISGITYKGVYRDKGRRPFASITVGGHSQYLGRHETEELAAMAYDRAAIEAFGEFAVLNFPRPAGPCSSG